MPIGYNGFMEWTRRRILQMLGASSFAPALAPALAPLLTACGGGATAKTDIVMPSTRSAGEIRGELREAVSELIQQLPGASALAVIRRRGGAFADSSESHASHAIDTKLILSASTEKVSFEQAVSDLSSSAIAGAVRDLRQRVMAAASQGRPSSAPGSIPQPTSMASVVVSDPSTAGTKQWIDSAWELYQLARNVGGSRIVYRNAYVVFDDTETLFIGAGRDSFQRLVRTRGGVVFVAQQTTVKGSYGLDSSALRPVADSLPVVEVAERSGLMGLEGVDVKGNETLRTEVQRELDDAAGRALSIISPLLPPSGKTEVILEPTVAALIVQHCIAPALDPENWAAGRAAAASLVGQKIAATDITLVDDPALGTGYGSYFFDDRGNSARPTAAIQAGILRAPIAPGPSNLILAPGNASRDELVAGVERGLLLEGGLAARADLRTWSFSVRAARAREIVNGKPTGVLYGAVELQGDIPALLASVRGLSWAQERFSVDAGHSFSVTSPYMLTEGHVTPAV